MISVERTNSILSLIYLAFPLAIVGAFIKNGDIDYKCYKNNIIKNLILAIDYNIKYNAETRAGDFLIFEELYSEAGYRDSSFKWFDITDYMEYELREGIQIKLVDLLLKNSKRKEDKCFSATFDGVAVKVIRDSGVKNEILIQRNKIIKGKERIKDGNKKFEKYFDLYARDMSSVDMIVTENVKQGLIELYEEYGIMFEISLYENNLYIRFFTGGLFETKSMALVATNKKKLYKEYVIFKTILTLIRRINELFSVTEDAI